MRKLKIIAVTLIMALTLNTASTFACTAVYVGNEVSADGSTILARSEDVGTGAYNKMFVVVNRVENVSGRTINDVNGFSYKLPKTTYKYTMIPDYSDAGGGTYAAACTNEYGLSITATVSAGTKDAVEEVDPYVEESLGEAVLPEIVAATTKTAKEGVELLANIIETYGSESGNVIMLADQKEAWIFEVYSGHLWAAQKMLADKVAVFGNQFMIETVNQNDTENVMFHKDLFTTADKNGWTTKVNGKVHLAMTYGSPRGDYSNMRTWIGHKLLAPFSVKEYKTDTYYPLFYTPDKKVSALDTMDVLRNRYEGTKYDASLPANKGIRVIGIERQSEIHVIQVKENYPAELSALQWLAVGNAEHSVFLPNFSGINDTYAAYKVDGERPNYDGAYWKFKRICALAEQNRSFFGQGVKDYWKMYEENLYADMAKAEKQMISLYAKDPAAAKVYATNLHMDIAKKACMDADHLYDDLLYFVMNKTGITGRRLGGPFVASVAIRDAAAMKGYTIGSTGKNNPITLTKGTTIYSITPGDVEYQMKENGKTTTSEMLEAPYIEMGTIYLPLDLVKGL